MTHSSEFLRNCADFYSLSGISINKVEEAEKRLGLQFAEDYKDYLLRFGLASANGHEFTGLCYSPRLNVVNVTEKERERNKNISSDMYVLEDLNIDHAIVWQSSSGAIYQTIEDSYPVEIYSSFEDYCNS